MECSGSVQTINRSKKNDPVAVMARGDVIPLTKIYFGWALVMSYFQEKLVHQTKHRIYLYLKPTQVGRQRIPRGARELSLRNSANWPRNFGRRGVVVFYYDRSDQAQQGPNKRLVLQKKLQQIRIIADTKAISATKQSFLEKTGELQGSL